MTSTYSEGLKDNKSDVTNLDEVLVIGLDLLTNNVVK